MTNIVNGLLLNETQERIKTNSITISKLRRRLEALKMVNDYKGLKEVNDVYKAIEDSLNQEGLKQNV